MIVNTNSSRSNVEIGTERNGTVLMAAVFTLKSNSVWTLRIGNDSSHHWFKGNKLKWKSGHRKNGVFLHVYLEINKCNWSSKLVLHLELHKSRTTNHKNMCVKLNKKVHMMVTHLMKRQYIGNTLRKHLSALAPNKLDQGSQQRE